MRTNTRKLRLALTTLTLVVTILVLAAVPAWAQTTRYVKPDGICSGNTPCYTTIQAAIDAASPDDTIIVAAGTYPEQLVIGKAGITLQGDGSYPMIQPALATSNKYDTVISIRAADITIKGLDISNALGVVDQGSAGHVEHHGIWDGSWTVGQPGLTVDDCKFHDIEHGVRSYGDEFTVTNSEFYRLGRTGVYASGYGASSPLLMTVKNNWFHDYIPVWKENHGVHVKYDGRVGEVSYNYMSGMRMGIAYYYGGPKSGFGQIVFRHNTFDLDYDLDGGTKPMTMGISLYGTGANADSIIIRDNIFANAWWYGIYQEDADIVGSITVDNNLFYNNNWYYWPDYQYLYQWFGDDTRAQAGWTGGESGFSFMNNMTAQDPLFALTDPGPEGQWALTCGSPAYGTASDGTNIGAWQGTLVCDNQGPITSNVVANPNPAPAGTDILLTANVDDTITGNSNIASAEYSLNGVDWTSMDASDTDFNEVSEDVTANIGSFEEPGVHDICVRGTDAAANTGPEECIFLAVYDPTAGFVTGGGWIDSPEGACQLTEACQDATGKATFGFVSKYKKGTDVPTGNTEFQFKAGNLNFHSASYDWLVVAGAKAMFKGIGTINGGGEFKFMLTAIDADINENNNFDVDRFRIKIWSEDDGGSETVVYDNGVSDDFEGTTEIGGGAIVIHAKKK